MSGTPHYRGGDVLLVAEQVQKVYRTGEIQVKALAGLDLTVHKGELVAVMGPSGSGKTTLLNCLSGLDDIDGGRVLVDGQDLFAMSDAKRTAHRATSMGFIFQAFNLIPVFTAAENVELPLLLGGTTAKEARRRAVQMLEPGRARRPGRPPAQRAVRRGAAAGHGGPGAGVAAGDRLGRRADRQPRHPDGRPGHRLLHELNRRRARPSCWSPTTRPSVPRPGGCIRMRDGRLVADQPRPTGAGGQRVGWQAGWRASPMYPNLTPTLVALLGIALAVAGFIAVRRPFLRRLALRQIARRRGEAALVVVGSVLGTAIIIGSLIVGDTLNFSVRQTAYKNLGADRRERQLTDGRPGRPGRPAHRAPARRLRRGRAADPARRPGRRGPRQRHEP